MLLTSEFESPYFRLFQATAIPDILSLCSSAIYAKKHVEYLKSLALDHNLSAQKFIQYAFAQYKKQFEVDMELNLISRSYNEVIVEIISPLKNNSFILSIP